MIILDSNIFIYLASGVLDRKVISDKEIAHASITKIECLGFSRIHANELLLLEALFGESYDLPLTVGVVRQAIQLRQAKNISLGDAIIAATALEHGYELWTANIDDFAHIEGLRVHNPLQR
ncbi:MAG: type II toxin-antitoxin system VapC family toxin [Candidatus Woesebacteria bacterium]|jgi:predicted nucleic acid-binding protein